jgi:hypothetical protein
LLSGRFLPRSATDIPVHCLYAQLYTWITNSDLTTFKKMQLQRMLKDEAAHAANEERKKFF